MASLFSSEDWFGRLVVSMPAAVVSPREDDARLRLCDFDAPSVYVDASWTGGVSSDSEVEVEEDEEDSVFGGILVIFPTTGDLCGRTV